MPKLTVQIPDGETLDFPITEAQVNIGRVEGNEVIIPHESLSSQHAVIFKTEDGGWAISDSNSTNGTFVDGNPVDSVMLPAEQPVEVIFGQVLATFTPDPVPAGGPAPTPAPAQAGGASEAESGSGRNRTVTTTFDPGDLPSQGRPSNFGSVSPFPKNRQKKDPAGSVAMLLGSLAILTAVALAGSVFVFLGG